MAKYKPEPFDLNRPVHLLAKDLLERIERRNKCRFIGESYDDVEQLIRQLISEIKGDCDEMHSKDHKLIVELQGEMQFVGSLLDYWELMPNDEKGALRSDYKELADRLDSLMAAVEG